MTDDDLSLDFILELQQEPTTVTSHKFGRYPIHLPNLCDSKYISLDTDGERYLCSYGGCKIKTHFKVEDQPFCSGHLAFPLVHILNRLEAHIKYLERENDRNIISR